MLCRFNGAWVVGHAATSPGFRERLLGSEGAAVLDKIYPSHDPRRTLRPPFDFRSRSSSGDHGLHRCQHVARVRLPGRRLPDASKFSPLRARGGDGWPATLGLGGSRPWFPVWSPLMNSSRES